MNARLIILRPQPGADATADRAKKAGWQDIAVHPLFDIAPHDWTPPDETGFDAVMLTSANTLRHAGNGMQRYRNLPVYVVGATTGNAARAAGFADVREHGPNVGALAKKLLQDGRRTVLHLAGQEVRAFDEHGLSITRIAVYASEPVDPPELAESLRSPAIALLHSPRAARRFAGYCEKHNIDRSSIAITAISPPTLHEAGGGWRAAAVAEKPGDTALLDAAARLG